MFYSTPYIPYVCLFLITLFSFLLDSNNRCLQIDFKYIQFSIISFIMIFFIGTRGYLGLDWINYLPAFDKAPRLQDGSAEVLKYLKNAFFEKGFSLYIIILKSICNDYLFMQFVSTAIDFIILDRVFRYYIPKYYVLGYCLFFMFQGFNMEIIIIRNTKAIMLFLLSIRYLENKKMSKYILLNLLGFFFHTSALIYFVIIPLLICRRNKRIELIFFLFGIIITLFRISWIMPLINYIAKKVPQFYVLSKLIGYASSEKYGSAYGISLTFIEHILSFIIMYKYIDKIIENDKRMIYFWKIFLCFMFIYMYCSELYIIVERIPNLFFCSYWILFPKLYELLKKDYKKIFLIIILIYGVLKIKYAYENKWACYDTFINGYDNTYQREMYFGYKQMQNNNLH